MAMSANSPTAWQPLTPHGVAAFARAPLRRLLLIQFIVAVAVALGIALFCYDRYVPVIESAIEKLPAQSQVRNQQLDWRGNSPVLLAENRFLSLSVDLDGAGQLRSVAHVQFDFGRSNVVTHSLFGYGEMNYPKGWQMAANREDLKPLWGAWLPALLAGTMVGTVLWLFLSWFALASVYALPVWWLGYFLNRELTLAGSWKLSGAALLPGALLMLAGISGYDFGALDLVGMMFIFGAHILLGWVYVLLGIFAAGRVASGPLAKKNPFRSSAAK